MSKKTILYAIIFSVILCLSGNTAFSQLKVKGDNGKVIIGTVPDESSQQYVEDFDNILSASIFGKGEFYRSGAKLSFGDFGRWDYWGWNVFVGCWLISTSQLRLLRGVHVWPINPMFFRGPTQHNG